MSIFWWMATCRGRVTLRSMPILTEPIGSIPRPASLIQAILDFQAGKTTSAALEAAYSEVLNDTIVQFEQTGSPVITDGEQTKPSFATYPLSGLTNLAPDGVIIPFADGHARQLPRLTAAPFRYGVHAATFIEAARRYTRLPIKQAVISASALSLLYPSEPIHDYSREEFLADLIDEAELDIRGALDAGAANAQIDFTEARLSLKLDPTGGLLRSFVALNNQVLERFTAEDRQRIGVHVCPGADGDSTQCRGRILSTSAGPVQFECGAILLADGERKEQETHARPRPSIAEIKSYCICRRHRSHRSEGRDRRRGS